MSQDESKRVEPSTPEQFRAAYASLLDVPSDVLASRIVGQLILCKGNLNKYAAVLEKFIDKFRAASLSKESLSPDLLSEIREKARAVKLAIDTQTYSLFAIEQLCYEEIKRRAALNSTPIMGVSHGENPKDVSELLGKQALNSTGVEEFCVECGSADPQRRMKAMNGHVSKCSNDRFHGEDRNSTGVESPKCPSTFQGESCCKNAGHEGDHTSHLDTDWGDGGAD